jgi:uncharacterized Zn-finger protein
MLMDGNKVKHKSFRIVTKEDLPFHCPPKESQKWNMHPKVFLSFDELGKTSCPYCGASYELEQ